MGDSSLDAPRKVLWTLTTPGVFFYNKFSRGGWGKLAGGVM